MYLHSIKAHLQDNALTDTPDDYIARVVSERSLNVRDIATSAVERGGADISAPAMEHAVNLWLKEMGYRLCDGFSINTGWFMAAPKIKGTFDSPTEKFNPQKHALSLDIRQGALLRKELGTVEVNITGLGEATAFIGQVADVKTGSVNDLITPSRPLKISGTKLKIAGESPKNGVFFINEETKVRTRVDESDFVSNNPSELIIVAPGLRPGMYKVEIVTQFTFGGSLKEPRTVPFDRVLTVLADDGLGLGGFFGASNISTEPLKTPVAEPVKAISKSQNG